MLLEGKNAVVYGGGGAVGSAVARTFAREGARVFLAGRTPAKLERVAAEIRAAGGAADVAKVDALDERMVDEHADAVVDAAGSLDISFNLIGHDILQGTPMVDMDVEDYVRPVAIAVRTLLVTSRAAARHMVRGGGGVILIFGGEGDPPRGYHLGSLQTVFQAMEAMRRQLATELADAGVRVVTLRTGGIAETLPADFENRDAIVAGIEGATLLGRAATLEDVGNVAAFVASDRARTMTGATVNVSAGALYD
jgi:NAD(P)-dependent dehydrogenase (short-subunit alcohol dehydrogenase family)